MTNRKSIIYTSGLLEKLYNLKSSDIKTIDDNTSCAITSVSIGGEEYEIGLFDNKRQAYILNSDEIVLMDILLSWECLVNDDENKYTTIMFDDIDWIRNRHKNNKERIRKAHLLYEQILYSLDSLYFVCSNEIDRNLDNPKCIFKVINIEYIFEYNQITGLKYHFGELGESLKRNRMVTAVDFNAFKFSLNEEMKYRLLRYLVTATFMNQVKRKSFTRTHKSILKGITYEDKDIFLSYYEHLMNCDYAGKYLQRYLSRLNEVLSLLKESKFIADYSIEPIHNQRELLVGFGKVEIYTNVSKNKKKRVYHHVHGT